jgi:hypothetical protein
MVLMASVYTLSCDDVKIDQFHAFTKRSNFRFNTMSDSPRRRRFLSWPLLLATNSAVPSPSARALFSSGLAKSLAAATGMSADRAER